MTRHGSWIGSDAAWDASGSEVNPCVQHSLVKVCHSSSSAVTKSSCQLIANSCMNIYAYSCLKLLSDRPSCP